jgi:NAD(P)-dependent dehydrogenase (short-subunit alcohol dehydrogenase family)
MAAIQRQRVALITGGAQGIGYACAVRLAEEDVRCALVDRNAALVLESAKRLGRTHLGIAADVTDPAQIKAAFASAEEALGPVNVVINSAGITGTTRVAWEVELEETRRVMDVNFFGTYITCVSAIPSMLRQGWGRIVNIASIAGKEGNPTLAAYSSSKGAVIALTKSLGKELATQGILVNAIAPAVIETPMNKSVSPETQAYMVSRIPMNRLGQPEEVAELVAYLASDRVSFATGAVFDISGGRATY